MILRLILERCAHRIQSNWIFMDFRDFKVQMGKKITNKCICIWFVKLGLVTFLHRFNSRLEF